MSEQIHDELKTIRPVRLERPERAEALSPGQRPGLFQALAYRPVRAKALLIAGNFKAFALTGRVFKIRLKFGTFFSRIIGSTN